MCNQSIFTKKLGYFKKCNINLIKKRDFMANVYP